MSLWLNTASDTLHYFCAFGASIGQLKIMLDEGIFLQLDFLDSHYFPLGQILLEILVTTVLTG